MTTETFEDAFELLEAVRTYKLMPREKISAHETYLGKYIGFTTVDGEGPAHRWVITVEDLRLSCGGRTSEEAKEVYNRMRFYSTRLTFADEIRSGAFSLDERPAPDLLSLPPEVPVVYEEAGEPTELDDFLSMVTG